MELDAHISTIQDAKAALEAGQVTAETLVLQALDAISKHHSLNAIAELGSEQALKTARERDREQAAGIQRGPLHGIPITVKDLFKVQGFSTRAGTRAQLEALGTSTAVARLQDAGAIVIAKANMHEIALGLTGENEWTGDVENPHDAERQSGGSSSGAAVAVEVGAGLASLGTDTGGSIRVPAALCGIVGFKPTHGLVPLDGALPLSPTCDHAGPLARNVADARLVTEVLTGQELPFFQLLEPRFGVPKSYLEGRLTTEMREAFEAMLVRLKTAGAVLTSIVVPDLELTHQAYTPLVRAEAAHVHRYALAVSPEDFSSPVRKALEAGAAMLASEYLEARAQRRQVIEGLRQAFESQAFDALILPTTPSPALRRGETIVNLESGPALHRDAQLALTAPFSMAGVPVAAIPFGSIDGLPVGVQLVTHWSKDALALNLASWMERLLGEPQD
ncbi:MAG: amidase [Sphingomonas bacterium]|nr:amidase [Sphingomonas bacterium]